MRKIIIYVVICLVLFGAGMGLSWVLGVPQKAAASSTAAAPEGVALADVVPADPTAPVKTDSAIDSADLPVAVRGKSLTAEELFRFGAMFRQQQEALSRREREIEQRQSRLQLALNDLRGSQQEFDGLRAQIRDAIDRGEQILKLLEDQRLEFEQQQEQATLERDQFEQTQSQQNADESKNLKKISAWFQGMPAEKAASYIRQLSNDGKMDLAVKLLGNIEERNAAKILAAMEDAALVVELTDAFREYKQPVLSARRERR